MTVGFKTFEEKTVSTVFTVKNMTTGANRRTIKIFNFPIAPGQSKDLLSIPEVSEADIRHSLLKGVLKSKGRAGEITVTDSNIDLAQFDEEQKQFLRDIGITTGVIGSDRIIQTLQDFPTPVNGVITLLPNTCYIIDGSLDIGNNIIQLQNNTTITGTCSVVHDRIIKSSGTGPLMRLADSSVFAVSISGISVIHPFGTAMSFSGDVTNTINLVDVAFLQSKVSLEASDLFRLNLNSGVFQGCSDGIKISGTMPNISLSDTLATQGVGAFTLISFTSTVSSFVAMSRIVHNASSAETGLEMSSSNLSVSSYCVVSNCAFIGPTGYTAITDVTLPIVPQFDFSNNIGIADSKILGGMSFLDAATPIVQPGSGAGRVEVVDSAGTSFTADRGNERFSIVNPSGNIKRLQYDGYRPDRVSVLGIVSGQLVGGGAQQAEVSILLNGDFVENSNMVAEMSGSNGSQIVTSVQLDINPGDQISLALQDVTGAPNVELFAAKLEATSAARGI